jgi:hypothetical protein
MVEQHWPKPEGPNEPLQDQRDFGNGSAEMILTSKMQGMFEGQ